MDPDVTLAELRELLDPNADLRTDSALDALDAARFQFAALDKWLSSGGFLPKAWEQGD